MRARHSKRRSARVQMREVGHLIRHERTADAGMLRPAVHAWFEESAVNDQLTAALEQIEQAHFAFGSVEHVFLFDGLPGHPTPFSCQCIARASERLLLHEETLVRSFPFLRGYDRRHAHAAKFCGARLLTRCARCHLITPLCCPNRPAATRLPEALAPPRNAHREHATRRSDARDHHGCACDACWAHTSLLQLLLRSISCRHVAILMANVDRW